MRDVRKYIGIQNGIGSLPDPPSPRVHPERTERSGGSGLVSRLCQSSIKLNYHYHKMYFKVAEAIVNNFSPIVTNIM